MAFEREVESPLQEKKETNGEFLVRVLKPAGCFLVLGIMAAMLLVCFTHRSDPVRDYVPPHSSAEYAAEPEALAAELRRNLLPYLGDCTCTVNGGKVEIGAPAAQLDTVREAVLRFYDGSLLIFTEK